MSDGRVRCGKCGCPMPINFGKETRTCPSCGQQWDQSMWIGTNENPYGNPKTHTPNEKNPYPAGSSESFSWELENFKRVMVESWAPICVPILRLIQRTIDRVKRHQI